jgi:mRNA-degrading endonuclease RelE of RelBE toxin-antitoxin system
VSDYRIDWSGPARRSLQRIPEKVATAVREFAYTTLAAKRQRMGKPLTLGMAGLCSSRRGDYRVIYAIDGSLLALLSGGGRWAL